MYSKFYYFANPYISLNLLTNIYIYIIHTLLSIYVHPPKIQQNTLDSRNLLSRVRNHIRLQMIEYILTFLSSSITINKRRYIIIFDKLVQ